MSGIARELARHLAERAEPACRHYLSNGRREGRYWRVGDVRNTPGGSLYLRLVGSSRGPAGKWTDAATGEHGDLLDVIRESCGLRDFRDVLTEASAFLRRPIEEAISPPYLRNPVPHGSSESARRLFAMSRSIAGTHVETYLRERGITDLRGTESLRFHPHCYYRPDELAPTQGYPAMIAAVTDLKGTITGAHRTWLDLRNGQKAPIETPRRAMGDLLGHAVRFGNVGDVMAAGEGIETVLSVRQILPGMPMAVALSAAHLAAIAFPQTLRRLYVIRDNDPAGERAASYLIERASTIGLEVIVLVPELGDFNEDLLGRGTDVLRADIRWQLAPQDVDRFIAPSI